MNNKRRQSGLSLIELMIGMVLGLIVIAAVINVYTGSSRSSKFTTGLQTMQENGRYGLSVLQREFRLAGYSPTGDIETINLGESSDTAITVTTTAAYDCNGRDTTAVGGIAENTYELDGDQLVCTGNVTPEAMPVVEGVEAFRVLYGLDTDGNVATEEPQRYVPYASVSDVSEVAALRFALLVNSGTSIRSRVRNETHVVLDQEVTSSDRFAREVFTTTVKLRNRREN